MWLCRLDQPWLDSTLCCHAWVCSRITKHVRLVFFLRAVLRFSSAFLHGHNWAANRI